MGNDRIQRAVYPLAAIVAVLFLAPGGVPAAYAKEQWTIVQSKNFRLVGNASDKDLRQVASRLEQFRHAFSRLFANAKISSNVPTTVIVFKNESSYKPFRPNAHTAAHFQAGEDVNYISLTMERLGDSEDPFRIIFHEYVHLLIKSMLGTPPPWFNEGLAEYYSTFSITDDRKVMLGKVMKNHVYFLREQRLLPLRTLFAVDQRSPYYNEKNKANVFYAQSWALVHYLILGNNGARNRQMGQFLDLIIAGKPVENAFSEAFQTTYEDLEKELKAYIGRDSYPLQTTIFKNKLAVETEMQSAPLTEAEAQAYLGDLLLHSRRPEAEGYLQKALSLDPSLPMANASLGLLRSRQERFEEARQYLEKAVTANTQNYLTHYYYAAALSHRGMDSNKIVYEYPPETLQIMRRELKKAIELAPDFPDAYYLLAFVNVVANEQFEESIALLKRAMALAPGNHDYAFMLAQLYLSHDEFSLVRQVLSPLAREIAEPEVRRRAQSFLDLAAAREEQKRAGAGKGIDADPILTERPSQPQVSEPAEPDPSSYLAEALRKPVANEIRILGTLKRIECGPKLIMLTIKTGERLLKIQTDAFNSMHFRTYTPTVSGEITCGLRKNEEVVVVIYKPALNARLKTDGTAISLEFVPSDFKLKP